MASKDCGLIEVYGLADVLPDNPLHFKQFSVQKTLQIPSVKPDAEQILSAVVDVKIKNSYIIKTPIGISQEGQKLTGKKLIVEGAICQKIEYVADEPTQSVHAVHFIMPFSTFIVIPACIKPGTPVEVMGYIEDIYIELLDKRTIFKNITLLLDAKFNEKEM